MAPINPSVQVPCRPPSSVSGYQMVASDGGIFSFGTMPFCGSMGATPLNAPVVGLAATPSHGGYWEVASDGGIFAFGNAGFYGSMGGPRWTSRWWGSPRPPTAGGTGRWPPTAGYSPSATPSSMARWAAPRSTSRSWASPPTPGGRGYWEVASDGGIFAFGDAPFYGSMGGTPLNRPIVGIASTPDGTGLLGGGLRRRDLRLR